MCILIPLLVGLISALLGYLLGKMSSKSGSGSCSNCDSLRLDLDNCRKKSATLQADLDAALKVQRSNFVANAPEASLPFNGDLAFAALGKKIKQDDLKIIEGIGPKIEELFHNAGIKTWKQLGETSVARCQEVLDGGGERFTVHNPGTWPKQAEMAYHGLWNDLKVWQDQLDGGKE